MNKSIIILLVAAFTVNAFKVAPQRATLMQRKAVIDDDMPGQLEPLGFFDPLGLSVGTTEKIFKRWQESEIKHGRVAMMAVVGILVAENYHPFYGGLVSGPAVDHFYKIGKMDPSFWLIPLLVTGIFEAYSIATAWAPRKETKGTVAWLREDHIPGNLGFDPLKLSPAVGSAEWIDIRNKELQNGRLAMMAVAGIITQELVDGKSIIGHMFPTISV